MDGINITPEKSVKQLSVPVEESLRLNGSSSRSPAYSTEALELMRQLRDWDLSNIHTRIASRAKSKEGHV
jgi:hypothetical protein